MSNDTTSTDAPTDAPAQEQPVDSAAEIVRLKEELAKARKWEDRAKANADAARELAQERAKGMTDIERVAAETAASTRTAVLKEVGAERAADAFRLASVGRQLNIEALLPGVNLAGFVDDDGKPLVKEIQAYIDGVAPLAEPKDAPVGRVPAGVRDSGKSGGDLETVFANFVNGQLPR